MPDNLYLTQEEWDSFSKWFMLHQVAQPDALLGATFYNYFDVKMEALKANSHLGGNPGHAPSLDDVLYSEKSNKTAREMIFDWFQFYPENE